MITDSWFVGIRCVLGMSKLVLQAITMIKTGQEFQEKLKGDDIPRGDHVAAVTNLYGVKMISLAYREKSDNGKNSKDKKAKFIGYLLSTYCVTTLPGTPEEKKLHYPDGTRSPQKFINR